MTDLLIILGPTASGKTQVACQWAYKNHGSIISADSRQLYRGMDIGTGKDLDEYYVNGTPIPYHLIDIIDAGDKFNVYEYQKAYIKAMTTIEENGQSPVLCGGSGMYIDALLSEHVYPQVPVNEDLREALFNEELTVLTDRAHEAFGEDVRNHDWTTKKRAIRAFEILEFSIKNDLNVLDWPKVKPRIIGINPPINLRRERITTRLVKRLESGMIEEVQNLIDSGVTEDELKWYGLEYKWIAEHLFGQLDREKMVKRLETAIHQFAKRQMTYFRKMEKDGWEIKWFETPESALDSLLS